MLIYRIKYVKTVFIHVESNIKNNKYFLAIFSDS